MTGPEHYKAAERLMEEAGTYTATAEGGQQVALVQRARVHVALAQVAATIDAGGYRNELRREDAWTEAIT
jgi:hypothetical protein